MTAKIKYRDILEILAKMSSVELDHDATIYLNGNEECYPIEGFEQWCPEKMDSNALDEGHWFFWTIA
jgi:hypothetical protein